MRSAITISLVPQARGGPFVFTEGLEAGCRDAAVLGFDAVEIFAPAAEAVDRAALRDLLARHGLRVAAFGTGAGWLVRQLQLTHPDAAVRAQARAFVGDFIDLGGAFGVPAIIGSMQGRFAGDVTREQALGWLAEALTELGARAAGHGVPLLIEPLNRYETNLLNRVGDTADFLRGAGLANVRVLADLFHMAIEEVDLADAIRAAGGLIGHVHFADSNRRAIGLGHTPVAPVIAALRDTGYAGYLSAEVVPLPDAQTAAAQTIKAFRQHVTGT